MPSGWVGDQSFLSFASFATSALTVPSSSFIALVTRPRPRPSHLPQDPKMAATTTSKVFVGNLVFSTTDEELKNAFAPSANVYVPSYLKQCSTSVV